jgi:hypothetical protein
MKEILVEKIHGNFSLCSSWFATRYLYLLLTDLWIENQE